MLKKNITYTRILKRLFCLLLAFCLLLPLTPGAEAASDLTIRTRFSRDITLRGVTLENSMFAQATTSLNPALAKLSAVLAANSRGKYASYTKTAAEKLGFGNYSAWGTSDASLPQSATAFCIADREILRNGDSTRLVLIQITDTSKAGDTVSNLDFLNKEDNGSANYSASTVLSYQEEAERILGKLRSRLNGYAKNENYIFWVTGCGRGGGVGNCLAKMLDDTYGSERVMAYLFGVGNTVKKTQLTNTGRYYNIFNINNLDDIQTCFPLSEWGYGRWGVEVQLGLPSDSAKRQTLMNQINSAFQSLTAGADRDRTIHLPTSYRFFGSGEYNGAAIRSFLKNDFYSIVTSPKDYYEKKITVRKYTDLYEMTFGAPATREKIPYNFVQEAIELLNQDDIPYDTMKDYLLMGAASYKNSCDCQKLIRFVCKYGFDITDLSASTVIDLLSDSDFELQELLLNMLPESYLSWLWIPNITDGILNYGSLPQNGAADSLSSGGVTVSGEKLFYEDMVFSAVPRSDVSAYDLSLKRTDGTLCSAGNKVTVTLPASAFESAADTVYLVDTNDRVTALPLTAVTDGYSFSAYDVNGTVFFGSPLCLSAEESGSGEELSFDRIISTEGGTLESGSYYLAGDTTLSENLTVPAGAVVNLCLNGHVLKGSGSGSVITVQAASGDTAAGTLNIYDRGDTQHRFSETNGLWVWDDSLTAANAAHTLTGGVITGGGDSGAAVTNSGELNIYGGNFAGIARKSEGGCITNQKNLHMYGGSISGSTNSGGAGGLYNAAGASAVLSGSIRIEDNRGTWGAGIWNKGTLRVTGAVIADNTAVNGGGGIAVSGTTYLTEVTIRNNTSLGDNGAGGIRVDEWKNISLTDCLVEGNRTKGCGGGIRQNGKLTLSGNTVIRDNGSDNLYFISGKELTVAADFCGEVWISTSASGGKGVVSKAMTKDLSAHFHADASSCSVICNNDGKLELVAHNHDGLQFQSFLSGSVDGSTITEGNYVLTGDVTLTANITVPAGKTLNLCLAGHVLQGLGSAPVITVSGNGTLNLYDCDSTEHRFSETDGRWVLDDALSGSSVKHRISGGCITGGKGGIYNDGTLTICGGNLVGNRAESESGGGISSGGTLTMYGGTVAGNYCSGGAGGIRVRGGTALLSGSILISGNSGRYGGGIWNKGAASLTLTGVTVADNISLQSGGGGGLALSTAATLSGVTVTGNRTVSGNGGGILLDNGVTAVLTDCSIENNSAAGVGGGISGKGELTLAGSTTVCNNSGSNLYLFSGKTVAFGSGFTGSVGVTLENRTGCFTGALSEAPAGQVSADQPLYTVSSDSDRKLSISLHRIGEVEFDTGISGECSGAELAEGDLILLGDVTLTENITVPAGKTLNLDLNGYVLQGCSDSPVITVSGADGETAAAAVNLYDSGTAQHGFTEQNGVWTLTEDSTAAVHTLQGGCITGGKGGIDNYGSLTIFGGNLVGNRATNENGGGISTDGTLLMYGGTVAGNYCSGGAGGIRVRSGFAELSGTVRITGNTGLWGGGIWNKGGSLRMNGGTISGNQANKGGGGIAAAGEVELCGTVLRENHAMDGKGGGLLLDSAVIATLTDCLVQKNSAAEVGGGISQKGTLCLAGNTTVTENRNGNLYIFNGKPFSAAAGFAGTVGITMEKTYGSFSTAGHTGLRGCFRSDNTDYVIAVDEDGVLSVARLELVAISFHAVPNTLEYLEGRDELSIEGGSLNLHFNDDSVEQLELSEDMVQGFDQETVGLQELTVSYCGFTATYEVTVTAKQLTGIELVSTPDRSAYLLNASETDLRGGRLKLSYNNGRTEELPLTAEMVSGFDGTTAGEQSLSVSCGGFMAEFTVTVGSTAGGRLSDTLRWNYDSVTGSVTAEGVFAEGQRLLAAVYTAEGQLAEAGILAGAEESYTLPAGQYSLSLYLLGEGQTPVSVRTEL